MANILFLQVLSVLILLGSAVRGQTGSLFSFLIFFILLFYAGLRGDVGSDTYSYGIIYKNSIEYFLLGVAGEGFKYEPLFLLFSALHKYYLDNLTLFFFSVSVIQVFLLWFCSRRLSHRWFFVLIYVLSFYFEFHFNVLRSGLAVLLFLCALSSRSRVASFLFLVSAPLVQLSVVALFPVYFYRFMPDKPLHKVAFFVISAFLILLILFLYQDYIFLKLSAYDIVSSQGGVAVGAVSIFRLFSAILMMILGVYVFFFLKSVSGEIKVSYFLLIAAAFVMAFFPIFFRVYSLSLVVFLYCCCRLPSFHNWNFRLYFLIAALLGAWQAYGSAYHVLTHYQVSADESDISNQFSITNYELYFESEFR